MSFRLLPDQLVRLFLVRSKSEFLRKVLSASRTVNSFGGAHRGGARVVRIVIKLRLRYDSRRLGMRSRARLAGRLSRRSAECSKERVTRRQQVRHRIVRRTSATDSPPISPYDPWSADCKSELMITDEHDCFPLTITDFASRRPTCCDALQSCSVERRLASIHSAIRPHRDPRCQFRNRRSVHRMLGQERPRQAIGMPVRTSASKSTKKSG